MGHGKPGYPLATRLNSFLGVGGAASVADAVRAVAAVLGITGLEPNYPQHLRDLPEANLADLLAETKLRLTGVNLRFEGDRFAGGAFTNPRAETRREAIATAVAAVAFAKRHGARHVILWMATDGFADPFTVDYDAAWELEIEGLRQVASADPSMLVSLEYKPAEPSRSPFRPMVGSMGEALLAVSAVGLPNVGITLDLCHSLMAGEHPPAAASLALARAKLFGVHLNDGDGKIDDGLPVGTRHPLATLELLAILRQWGYRGGIYFDTFPDAAQAAVECAANVATVRHYEGILDRLDPARLSSARAHGGFAAVCAYLRDLGLQAEGDESVVRGGTI